MADLITHTTVGPTGTTTESWNVDGFKLLGLGVAASAVYGGLLWVRQKVLGRGR